MGHTSVEEIYDVTLYDVTQTMVDAMVTPKSVVIALSYTGVVRDRGWTFGG